MEKIIVGSQYKEAFDSACRLVESGCIGSDVRIAREGGRKLIDNGTYLFALGDDRADLELDDISMTGEGASWFGVLRGGENKNQNAVWVSFIETLASRYHKRFSLVEYMEKPPEAEEEEKKSRILSEYADRLTAALFPDLVGRYTVRRLSPRESAEDIYGVSMRIELSGGAGAAMPVLCRVYFKKTGHRMIPVSESEAQRINDYLRSVKAPSDAGKEGGRDGTLVDEALTALEVLIEENGGAGFADAICYDSEEDAKAVGMLVNGSHEGDVQLECTRVKTLGVLHLKWNIAAADLCVGERRLLRVVAGEGGRVTLNCLNCGDGYGLVENNEIRFTDESGKTRAVTIDPTRADLGFGKEKAQLVLKEIRESDRFKKHLFRISCKENLRNENCSSVACESEAFCFETAGGKKIYKCKDCPFPEIVYRGADGAARYTPSLAFVRDKGALADKKTVRYCSLCGRAFSAAVMKGARCRLCNGTDDGGKEAEKTYRKYADILSVGRRLSAGKKYCYEDDEILIFVVGNKKFVFDKLDVGADGYIKAPKKM